MAGCRSVDAVNEVSHEDGSETTSVLPISAISGVDSGYEVLSSLGGMVCTMVVAVVLIVATDTSPDVCGGGTASACFWRTAGLDLLDVLSAFSAFSGVVTFDLTCLGGAGVLGFGARAVLGLIFLIGPPPACEWSSFALFFPGWVVAGAGLAFDVLMAADDAVVAADAAFAGTAGTSAPTSASVPASTPASPRSFDALSSSNNSMKSMTFAVSSLFVFVAIALSAPAHAVRQRAWK